MPTADVLVLVEPGHLEHRSIPIPALRDGESVLAVEACGLCGTDHELYSGALRLGVPFVPGHEIVGTVAQTTPAARAERGLEVGDRIALEVFQRCGRCDECRAGVSTRCRRHGLGDAYGMTPIDRGPGLWGGFATHVLITRDAVVHRVPDGVDPVVATLFNPLGAGIRWGTKLSGLRPGAVVAVLGPGLRGLCTVAAVLAAGARFVLLTGAGPRDHDRLRMGSHFGAHVTVDVTADDAVAALVRNAGGLADVVVDVTAAAPAAFAQALDLARVGGTVVVAGTRGDAPVEQFRPDPIVLKELTLVGALGVEGAAYRDALTMIADDDRFAALSRRVVPLDPEPVAALLDDMAHGEHRPLHAVVAPVSPAAS